MTQSELDRTFNLPSGRALGYALMGDPGGRPAFFFHGFPGSRLSWRNIDSDARRLGVRVIAPDRPGYGLSEFKRRRKLLDWPKDVLALADYLGLETFSALGTSGGGPHAAACAYVFPQRLKSTVIVSGQAPLDAPGMWMSIGPRARAEFRLAKSVPFLLDFLYRQMTQLALKDPQEFLRQAVEPYSAADRKLILEQEDVALMVLESYLDGFRQGPKAAVQEGKMLAGSWGFRLEEIRARVYLWQGEADTETPAAMGRYLAEKIPGCQATFVPGEGHFSVLTRCLPEILAVL